MANLQESADWVDGIYQLETSDPVIGGPDGIDNLQAKQLAARTQWLRATIAAQLAVTLQAQCTTNRLLLQHHYLT